MELLKKTPTEINKYLAVKVMGWDEAPYHPVFIDTHCHIHNDEWRPYTRVEHAMLLVPRIPETFELHHFNQPSYKESWSAVVGHRAVWSAWAKNPAQAICKAVILYLENPR